MQQQSSPLSIFIIQLIRFFEDLYSTYPEERDIKSAIELIKFAKASNPRIILDIFHEHFYMGLNEAIRREDADFMINFAREKIETQFNEISPALTIFNKYWNTMSDASRKSIWNYLKVLCILCERAR